MMVEEDILTLITIKNIFITATDTRTEDQHRRLGQDPNRGEEISGAIKSENRTTRVTTNRIREIEF